MVPLTQTTKQQFGLSVIDPKIITYARRAWQRLHIPLKAGGLPEFSFAILEKPVQLRAIVYSHTPNAVIELCLYIQNSKGSH